MNVITVPYHLDEYLPDLDLPLGPGKVIKADLPPADAWRRLAVLYGAVAEGVASTARAGGGPVVVSGDCTTSLAVVAGLQRAGLDPGIVWFDAHGDVQTRETTASSYLGGLPLRLLAGYRPELIAASLGLPAVRAARRLLRRCGACSPPAELPARASAAPGSPAVARRPASPPTWRRPSAPYGTEHY